jgi:hypothetical protein
VAPGVRILDRKYSQLAKLERATDSALFKTYVNLMVPIIELGNQRFETGKADPERGKVLERLIAGLEDEQSALARSLGLKACSITFVQAL